MPANPINLDDLITALAGSVIEAQDQIQRHQLTNLTRYFHLVQAGEDEASASMYGTDRLDRLDVYRPQMIRLRLPVIGRGARPPEEPPVTPPSPSAEKSPPEPPTAPEEEFFIPLAALVPHTALSIKDMKITFHADIGEVNRPEVDKQPERQGFLMQDHLDVTVEIPQRKRRRANTAKVTLRVQGTEPTEAVSRLLQHLIKLI